MKYLAVRLVVALSTFFIGTFSAALLAPLSFDAAAEGEAKQEILQMEREYIQAHLNRDTSTLNSILADEFTIKSRWVRGTTKARRLALLENPDFAFEAFDTDKVEVEVNGNNAVVRGVAVVQSRYQDEKFISPQYKFIRQYEKRSGRWQIVSVRVKR